MPTDTKLNQLIINQLTQEQYNEAKAAGTLSDTELYITDSDDEALTNNNISNCITEIPQDIKLELNNGTLTLKAGSKVYVPNGVGVFDVVTIASDKTITVSAEGKQVIFLNSGENLQSWDLPNCFSGSTAPTSIKYPMWYDTTNNIIKSSNDNGSTWSGKFSFPICIVTVSNGTLSSIDQVFNGFGYIGSTVYALPGVKGLIPNGRNADGSLKSIEFVNDRVRTFTASGSGYGLTYFLCPDYVTNLGVVNSKAYVEKDTRLTTFDNNVGVWFDTKQNIMLRTYDSGTTWTRVNYVCFSYMFMTNAGHLDYLVSKTVFHAVDSNDSSWLSGLGMPSGRFIDLTPAHGQNYIAPANGYFALQGYMTGATFGNTLGLYNQTKKMGMSIQTPESSISQRSTFIPASKGDTVTIYCYLATVTQFSFIFAEGEN